MNTIRVAVIALATLLGIVGGVAAVGQLIDWGAPGWSKTDVARATTGVVTVAALVSLIIAFRWRPGPSDAGVINAPSALAEAPVMAGAPASLGDAFVGRKVETAGIQAGFAANKRAVVIAGGPGMGKSRLAAEYVHRHKLPGYWVNAEGTVERTLARLATGLMGADAGGGDDKDLAAEAVKRLSECPPGTVLVVDSAPSLDFVNELVNRAGKATVLATTRDARKGVLNRSAGALVEIRELDRDSAVSILCSRVLQPKTINPRDPRLREIAKAVGDLPLALEALAVRLAEDAATPESVLGALRKTPNPVEFEAFKKAGGETIRRPDGVFVALQGTLTSLPPDVRTDISGIGYVADVPVPFALAKALSTRDGSRFDDLLRECRRQSVLTVAGDAVVVHALTSAAIAAANAATNLEVALGFANRRLNAINTDDPRAMRGEAAHYGSFLAHARRILGVEHESTLAVANNLAVGLRQSLGRTTEAVTLDEETLPVRVHLLGAEHPDTLANRNNLANGYRAMGRTAEAVTLNEETLRVSERVLGAEHPHTLASRNNLAEGFRALGRTAEAAELDEGTLRLREQVLGPEHRDTLASRNNLAIGYRALGRIAEAVKLDEGTQPTMERVLGPEHPETLASRDNLAADYYAIGRTVEAVRLWEETLSLRERILGLEHPATLKNRTNLAGGYQALSRNAEAVRVNEETLRVMERVLGLEHPDTLSARNNLAIGYATTGRVPEALPMFEAALEARVRVLGKDHPDAKKSRGNLARAYRDAGREEDAKHVEGGWVPPTPPQR